MFQNHYQFKTQTQTTMFGINNQQPVATKQGLFGVRQKYATKKALKQNKLTPISTQQPITGRKHILRKHKNVSVVKPSLFQRIKFAIMSRLNWLSNRPMITAAPKSTKKNLY
jgi:hypothetical protein